MSVEKIDPGIPIATADSTPQASPPTEHDRKLNLPEKPSLLSAFFKKSTKTSGSSAITGGKKPPPPKGGIWAWVLFGVAIILLSSVFTRPDFPAQELGFSEFLKRIDEGVFSRVVISGASAKGYLKDAVEVAGATDSATPREDHKKSILGRTFSGGPYFTTHIVENGGTPLLLAKLSSSGLPYEAENTVLRSIFLNYLLPVIFFVLMWRLLFSRAFRMGPGAGIMSFGKNRARLVADDAKKVTFNDVAGVEEAKEELTEIIDFLKNPQKFRAIGGKIPKGILLVGPPGTGKTLLARAVSGEAGVPFFSLSGSEFVEMFVGVGASRVRDLFAQAIEKSPCIIFIDELDAIGKVRSAVSPMGGHDEREQTLNQLLVEMDGFDTRTGVIIMAATNRPETLDPALLRAGRFDRQVLVDRPDIRGREEILRVHSKNVKMEPSLDLKVVAARTAGFVGADLANVVNEAALLAVRKGKSIVELSEFEDAIDRVVAGLQKKTRLMNLKEKQIVAHHETGHALVTYFTEGTDPVHKISVIPRGFGALGFTMALPKEDRYLMTKSELLARIDILLGGRVAEEVMFNEISTGAQDDLQKATDISKRMVMEYGMSGQFGQRTFSSDRSTFIQSPSGPMTFSKEYSDRTAEKIDQEVQDIMKAAYQRVKAMIESNKSLLAHVATVLSEKEVLDGKEFADLVAGFGQSLKMEAVDAFELGEPLPASTQETDELGWEESGPGVGPTERPKDLPN